MEPIYLSPRKILSYLKDLETKVPIINDGCYLPNYQNSFTTNTDLEEEAKSILNFVGLTECKPKCRFDKTDNGVAGFTKNNHSIYEIEITVNEDYRKNPKACSAILVHEICHKVIFLNGIDFKYPVPQEYNEIYTDLCTIYIGLGKVVLDGYIDTNTKCLKMGYLKVDMYRQTYNIIAKTTNKYTILKGQEDINDPLLEEALTIWGTPEDVKSTLKKSFLKNEYSLAEVNRNILLLKQILNQVYIMHGNIFRKLSNEATELGIFGQILKNKPITLFSNIYESLFDHSEFEKFSLAQREIYNLILAITDEYKDISIGALSYNELVCPNCGYTSKTNIEDRDTIVKCPSCSIYFRFCNTHLNITQMRMQRNKIIAKKNEEAKKLKDAQAKLEREINDFEEKKRLHLLELQKQYQKGIKEGICQANKQNNRKYKYLISQLPKWLKLLIGKKLPSDL